MTSSLRKAFLLPWKPNVQAVRYRNRINIQRPALPHYRRAKVLKVCEPTFPTPAITRRPGIELCLKPVEIKKKKEEEENMFAKILARELYSEMEQSQFVGFFHTCPISAEEKFKVRVALMKVKGTIKVYGKIVVEKAWQNTYYEPALCLLKSHTTLVFCPDGSPQTVADIIKIFRRVPALVLMAAIIDKRMMSRKELDWYSKLSDLTTERAKLATLLSAAPGGRLLQDLSSLQNTFIHQLTQRASQLEASNTESTGSESGAAEEKVVETK